MKSPVSIWYPWLEKKANLTMNAKKSRAKTMAVSRFPKGNFTAAFPHLTQIQPRLGIKEFSEQTRFPVIPLTELSTLKLSGFISKSGLPICLALNSPVFCDYKKGGGSTSERS
jgi:hypothetical protein